MQEMKGIFIYKTDKRRTVYCDLFSKKAHYINQRDYKIINLFQLSLPLAILIMYLLNSKFGIDMLKSLIIVLVILIIVKIVFNFSFISKLPIAKDFVKPKNNMSLYLNQMSNTRLVLVTILLIIFAILTFVVIKQKEYEGTYLIMNYIMIGISLFIAIISICLFIKRLIEKRSK